MTLAISFVAFGVINPLEVNFLKEGNVAISEAINDAVDCDEANQCTYTFVMTDQYGDGWNGGTMTVFQNEEEVETFGLTSGETGTIEIALCDGEPFSLYWNAGGSFSNEVGITILDAFGEEIYSKPPDTGSPDSELYTGVVDCTAPSCPKPINVEAEVTVDSATISWTEQGDATEWEVIVVPAGSGEPSGDEDDIILTTDNPYTFEDLDSATSYEFYVRAICDATTDDISGWRSFVFMTVIANDECDAATEVPVNTDATCDLTASGTFQGATLSEDMPGPCDDWSTIYQDVWFEFEAVEGAHMISILNQIDWGISLQVFTEDICTDSEAEPLACATSPLLLSNLIPGEVYKIRVFSTNSSASSSFDVCVRTLNSPENDDCDEAIDVPVNTDATCTLTTSGTFEDATLSSIGGLITCYEWDEAVKDVWFEFEATDTTHKVTLLNALTSYNIYLEVFEEADCNTP
ncbi:fibronectin type III domain-containing protein, partial [Avrilella dinanensis]|uniref:fibronectin type III domain-containing protein n=1 Tax=Avrilella dinanensis TaxID=2008672 RepID=UPI002409C2D3